MILLLAFFVIMKPLLYEAPSYSWSWTLKLQYFSENECEDCFLKNCAMTFAATLFCHKFCDGEFSIFIGRNFTKMNTRNTYLDTIIYFEHKYLSRECYYSEFVHNFWVEYTFRFNWQNCTKLKTQNIYYTKNKAD